MNQQFMIGKPGPDEYPEWAEAELRPVPYYNLLEGLKQSHDACIDTIGDLSEEKLLFRYETDKWTIKEMWQHIIDTERVLAYRALRYARQDGTILSGFDQNQYALVSRANERAWKDMLDEYTAVRQATISLFNSFSEEMFLFRGQAGRSPMTVRSVGYLIIGHELHHTEKIKELYLR